MGLFDFVKICLFSEVNGIVTLNGKPVAGVEVIRTSQMGHDNIYTDKTVTDEQGRYRFAARFTHSVRKIAPVEPVITQKIAFFHQDREYLGWEAVKDGYELNTELGQPINLACELGQEPKIKVGEYLINGEHSRRAIYGVCIAEGMSIKEPTTRKSEE